MRAGVRLGVDMQQGGLLWKLTSFLCGLLLLPTIGMILVGQSVHASVWLCVVLALRRGIWWLLTRQRRQP
jgi:hypothetical protein